jgi:hypothetical protein
MLCHLSALSGPVDDGVRQLSMRTGFRADFVSFASKVVLMRTQFTRWQATPMPTSTPSGANLSN